MKTLPLLIRNCTVHRYPALAAFISGVLPPSDSCSWKWYQYQWCCVHTWPDQRKIIIQKTFTSSAPCSSKASATSVWPFSQAYVRAVSPVPVVAWTLAPVNNPQTGQLTSLASLIIPPSFNSTVCAVIYQWTDLLSGGTAQGPDVPPVQPPSGVCCSPTRCWPRL